MVSQEPTLFACSIKDNIMYGKDATLEEVGTLLWLLIFEVEFILDNILFNHHF